MKTHRTLLKAIAAALLVCTASLASASDSQTLATSATMSGICKFSTSSTPLAFGTIDPSLLTDKVATANVLYKCTKGTASAGVTVAGGNTRLMTVSTTALAMAYTLGLSGDTQTGKGFGTGQDLTLVVTGTITAAQYQNVTAGAYAETVTLNITP
ncbi:MAG: hypothetical protein HHJ16_01770 [Polaromonas sp.]|uniref:hypothetical protein n=1 Tax=Polaromonas sp. TaxID=1869339 RepID=UPI00179321AA|nr:hypothetical protein [Polaromonas sp.]NMM08989.1 hypothetical protein [Polaromonas sp.]